VQFPCLEVASREPSSESQVSSGKDEDGELFRAAVRDVKRLRAPVPAIHAPKPPAQARFTRADEREVLRESLLPPSDEAAVATGEELSFRRHHIPEAVLLKLRRGHYVVDAEVDLHGLNSAEARIVLRDFIAEATLRGYRCVRIVHGKGKRSGTRGPVLKHLVNHWLQRMDAVLAFGSARAVDGGNGAVYVLLRC
jgi:DNA-nicking Smr family endonuclease